MGEIVYAWDEQQREAMQEAAGYLSRLIPATEEMADEFKGELQEDSYDVLDMVVEGLNWVIQVYNGTKDVINKESEQVDSKAMDQKISKFGTAYTAHDQSGIVSGLEEAVLPFLRKMKEIADQV